MHSDFFANNTVVFLGLFFLATAWFGWVSGRTSLRMVTIERSEHPVLFTATLSIYAFAGGALIGVRLLLA